MDVELIDPPAVDDRADVMASNIVRRQGHKQRSRSTTVTSSRLVCGDWQASRSRARQHGHTAHSELPVLSDAVAGHYRLEEASTALREVAKPAFASADEDIETVLGSAIPGPEP